MRDQPPKSGSGTERLGNTKVPGNAPSSFRDGTAGPLVRCGYKTALDRRRLFLLRTMLTLALCWCSAAGVFAEQSLHYETADTDLKVVQIDRSRDASLVSVRVDTLGRVFVGGRESVFIYEPDDDGGYQPGREIYRFPPHSWVFDLAIRGHDLYVATASAIYVLPGAVNGREALQAKRLIWGQPLGHLQLGFFGLAWGPEGDLYFSSGDPLQHYGDFNRPDHWGHWTLFSQPEGTATPYTGVGGVLRCRPDGSRLQVVARGIFRSCGLTFDRHWNLFTDDNDREAMPVQYVPARLLHVTPHADFGWPRGWMAAKSPDRADLLETMHEGLGREAPVGLAYYDETYFPDRYRQKLLLARWAQRVITRHQLNRHGATFKTDEQPLLVGHDQSRPVGVCVGRGGRIFATLLHMPQLEGSPTCPSDLIMITRADDSAEHPFEPCDLPSVSAEKLWSEVSDPSWSRRRWAHTEILRRGGRLLDEAVRQLARTDAAEPAVNHLLWLAAASQTPQARQRLVELAGHEDANVRFQAIRALTEFFATSTPRELLTGALADPAAPVQHRAALAFFGRDDALPDELIRTVAGSRDTYLRQSAALLLAERASLVKLEELSRSDDPATRLAGVLAAGFRLTLPPATEPIGSDLLLSPYPDSACVIQFDDAKIDLRELGRLGNFTVAEHWKAGQHAAEQEALFDLLVDLLSDKSEQVRLQAAHFLLLLNDARSEPLVAKTIRASEEQRLAAVPVSGIRTISGVWTVGPFPDGDAGLKATHPPERGPIDLAAEYSADGAKRAWKQLTGRYFDFSRTFEDRDGVSYYAYCRLESPRRQRILLFVGSNDGVKVWHNGQAVWQNEVVRRALAFQDPVFVELQPGSNELLVRVQNVSGDSGLFLSFKSLGQVEATLPEKLATASLAERLKAAAQSDVSTAISSEFLDVDWSRAVGEGDANQGRRLFGSEALGCAKCHAVTDAQAGGNGPSLTGASRRFTMAHLVESILLPSKSVSPVFRATLITTADGKQTSGLVVAETADKVEFLLPDTTRRTIAKRDIEAQKLLATSPMPQGIVKTPVELQDLLAYLLSDNPQPPTVSTKD